MATQTRRRTRAPIRVRSLWISDVHLGFAGSQAGRLADFLAQHECERLYLVGDIIDGWKLRTHFYWPREHTRVVSTVLAMARRGTEVFYLAGNHDGFMREFLRGSASRFGGAAAGRGDFGRIHFADEVVHTTADGRRLLVLHGDVFDDVVGLHWLAQAGDVGYEALLWAGARVNRLRARMGKPDIPLSAATKTRVKSAVQYLSGFDEKVIHRCRTQGYQGVICGHTHHAEMRYLRDGIVSYNCGDWVESCTALAEDAEGNIDIVGPGVTPQRAEPKRQRRRLPEAVAQLQA